MVETVFVSFLVSTACGVGEQHGLFLVQERVCGYGFFSFFETVGRFAVGSQVVDLYFGAGAG